MQSFEIRFIDQFGEALSGNIGIDTEFIDDACTEAAQLIISKRSLLISSPI